MYYPSIPKKEPTETSILRVLLPFFSISSLEHSQYDVRMFYAK